MNRHIHENNEYHQPFRRACTEQAVVQRKALAVLSHPPGLAKAAAKVKELQHINVHAETFRNPQSS
jgi:hypothetical protein